jgi:all-trans-8'-apo-beta-carotenal 15,15'-oxygenase
MSGIVVDLRTMTVAKRFELPPGIVIHFANSFEVGDEIVTDFFHTTDTQGFSWLGDVFAVERVAGASLNRLRINIKDGRTAQERYDSAPIGEFPAWDTNRSGTDTRHCFYVAHAENRPTGFFNSIVKLDTVSGEVKMVDVGENRFTSEALFVARDGATATDDGYLLAVVYDAGAHRSEVVVLEAANPENELAAVMLNHHVPFGFHGSFTRETFLA